MALTITTTRREVAGRQRVVEGTATFDANYATSGESFAPSSIGLVDIHTLDINQGEDGYVFNWDGDNEKILVYEAGADGAALDEVASSTDLSTTVIQFRAYGT